MEIQCSSCQKRLKLPDNAAGKKIRCPICQNVFQVSAPAPVEKKPEPNVSLSDPRSSVLELPPEPKNEPDFENLPQENQNESLQSEEQSPNLSEMIASSKRDIEKATTERDEAMEMVDGIFQMFMERADNPNLNPEEQQEYREIAQKIFGLQRRFPILSGVKSTLELCEAKIK